MRLVINAPWAIIALSSLLFLGILFGGGGVEGPINNGVIEAVSAAVLLGLVGAHFAGVRPLPRTAVVPLLLLLALVILLGLQLMPLPPSLWQTLPGREVAQSALALISKDKSWRQLSLDPEATRRFAASVLPAAALLVGVLAATRQDVLRLGQIIICAAVVSGAIGGLQLTLSYPSWLTFYDGPNPGAGSGVFANSNHQGSLMAAAIICTAMWIRGATVSGHARRPLRLVMPQFHPGWLIVPFLAAASLATRSRASATLMLIALAMSAAITLKFRRTVLGAVAAAGIATAALLLLLLGSEIGQGAIHPLSDELRFAYLPDLRFVLGNYWPFGSGAGTFPAVFAAVENLDLLQPERLNHAHDEYLEWLIELGAPGALWMAIAFAAVVWRMAQISRTKDDPAHDPSFLSGLCILVLLIGHSIVDYPLRTDALALVAAFAAALIFAPLPESTVPVEGVRAPRLFAICALIVGCIGGAQVLRLRAAEAAVRKGQPTMSVAIRPQNGDGLALLAKAQLSARKPDAARSLAALAIDRSPASVAAVSALAAADTLAGRNGTTAWRVAAALGWRDHATQLWALHQSFAGGEYDTAALRADALLRTDNREQFQKLVRPWGNNPTFRTALAERLRLNPDWRRGFFALDATTPVAEVNGALAILAELGRVKALRRADARAAILVLIERQQYAAAHRLYGVVQPPPVNLGSLNPDPGFDRTTSRYIADATAFDWQLSPAPGAMAEVSPDSRTLVIESNGSIERRAAYRYLLPKPGAYALDYRIKGSRHAPSAIRVDVSCANDFTILGRSPIDDLAGAKFEHRRFVLDVPASCPAIVISFNTFATGEAVEAEFDDVRLIPR